MGTFGGCNHNACSASKILCSFLSLSPQVSGMLQIFLTELFQLKPVLTISQGKLVFPKCLLVSVSLRTLFHWRSPEFPTSQPQLSQGSRCLPQLLWTGKLIPHFLCSGSFHSWGGLSERRDRPWFRGTTHWDSENTEPVPFLLLWMSAESGKWTQDYLVAKCIVFVIAKSQRHWIWNPGFSTCYLFPRLWNGYLISSYHKRRSRPVSTGDLCHNTECLLLSL